MLTCGTLSVVLVQFDTSQCSDQATHTCDSSHLPVVTSMVTELQLPSEPGLLEYHSIQPYVSSGGRFGGYWLDHLLTNVLGSRGAAIIRRCESFMVLGFVYDSLFLWMAQKKASLPNWWSLSYLLLLVDTTMSFHLSVFPFPPTSHPIYNGSIYLRDRYPRQASSSVFPNVYYKMLSATYLISAEGLNKISSEDPYTATECRKIPDPSYFAINTRYHPVFCQVPNNLTRYDQYRPIFPVQRVKTLTIPADPYKAMEMTTDSVFQILDGGRESVRTIRLCKTTGGQGIELLERCSVIFSESHFKLDGFWSVSADYTYVIATVSCIICIGHSLKAQWVDVYRTNLPTPFAGGKPTLYFYTLDKGMHKVLSPLSVYYGYNRIPTREPQATGATPVSFIDDTLVFLTLDELTVKESSRFEDLFAGLPTSLVPPIIPGVPQLVQPIQHVHECRQPRPIMSVYDQLIYVNVNSSDICAEITPFLTVDKRIDSTTVDEVDTIFEYVLSVLQKLIRAVVRFLSKLFFDSFGTSTVILGLIYWVITRLTGSGAIATACVAAITIYYGFYD